MSAGSRAGGGDEGGSHNVDDARTERGARDETGVLRYLLVLSRPRFWLYVAGPVLVGAAFGAQSVADLWRPQLLALFAYALLPANVLIYGVNDRFDREMDAANPKKEGREARFAGGALVWAAIGGSALLGALLTAWLPPGTRVWMLGFFFLAVFYSAPPLRFKVRPLLDSLSNGLYILPGVAAYTLLAGEPPPTAAILGGWLWTMAMHTFSAIPDIAPDRAAGVRTTATVLGTRGAYAYCSACWLAAAAAFGSLSWAFVPVLGLYPVFVGAIVGLRLDVERAYWWFPALNTVVGMSLTLAGLWRLTR